MLNAWTNYTHDLPWVKNNAIYVTVHGSHAYGTSTPESDLDIRGITIAPKPYYLGTKSFEQTGAVQGQDITVFELRKFLRIASEANPNMLELLYTDPADHLVVTPIGAKLLANRGMFLTKRIKHTFSGYAYNQMKRINTHRAWLLNPVDTPPTRKEFGLPERTVIPADQLAAAFAAISKKVDQWNWHHLEDVSPDLRIAIQNEFAQRLVEITLWSETDVEARTWAAAANSIGIDTNFVALLDQERKYRGRMREYTSYQTWKKERNPARAALEEKHGFDTKHAMHLVRLGKSCEEALRTGHLHVKRPDAKELLEIRRGSWSYEQLVDWFEQQQVKIEEAYKSSTLPKRSNMEAIDQLCIELVQSL